MAWARRLEISLNAKGWCTWFLKLEILHLKVFSCGMSCCFECTFKHWKSDILKDGRIVRLDESFICVSCGKTNDMLGCWRSVTPQNLLQGHDSHFTPQAQRLKVETTQTFVLKWENMKHVVIILGQNRRAPSLLPFS